MTYLHQHSRTLNFELDFRNPKEYVKEREPRPTEKQSSAKKRKREDRSKRPSDNKRKSPNNKNTGTATTIPYKLQCKRPDCIARRTSTNHAHDKCKFKDKATEKPYPNIGKAPPKRTKKTNHSAAPKGESPFDASKSSHNGANTPSPAFADTRTCYICNAEGHIATTCPQKQVNKSNAKARLKSNKSCMALWKTHFPTEPENLCATRILDAWDEPNYCTTCLQPEGFNHVCRQDDRNVYQHVQKVKNAMTSTSMLNDIVQAHEPYTSTEESTSATIDYTFFSHAGGQGHGHGLGLTSIHLRWGTIRPRGWRWQWNRHWQPRCSHWRKSGWRCGSQRVWSATNWWRRRTIRLRQYGSRWLWLTRETDKWYKISKILQFRVLPHDGSEEPYWQYNQSKTNR
jgi:hypothetical protein